MRWNADTDILHDLDAGTATLVITLRDVPAKIDPSSTQFLVDVPHPEPAQLKQGDILSWRGKYQRKTDPPLLTVTIRLTRRSPGAAPWPDWRDWPILTEQLAG